MNAMTGDWRAGLNADPLPWLLDPDAPAIRHRALVELLDRPTDDPEVVDAGRAAMTTDPIATILARQDPEGWWVKPGVGYSPKYTSTVWTLIFLDQLGADGANPRIARGCEYVLRHAQASSGGGYVADVLQVMEAVCEAGAGADPRLATSVSWLLAQQDAGGRWKNRYPYRGKMHIDIDRPGAPSRWVTFRACRVLRMVAAARGAGPAGQAHHQAHEGTR